MTSHKHAIRTVAGAIALVAVLALAATAGAKPGPLDLRSPDTQDAAQAGSQGPSVAELRALHLRSQALNERYGLGSHPNLRSPDTQDAALQANSPGPTAAELRALQIRSQALNQRYGLGTFAKVADGRSPDTIDASVTAHAPVVTVVQSPDFAWGDFGVGIAAAFAAMSLIGLAVLTGRRNSKNRTIATA